MRIAVSGCLLGRRCRYDGGSKPCEAVIALGERHDLLPVCPEVAGGMRIPHAPNEIVGRDPLCVMDDQGVDHTEEFSRGAEAVCRRVVDARCDMAILKAKSPSCGVGRVYDGSFTGTLVEGNGVAAQLLIDAGVPVCDENHLSEGL